MKAGWLFSKNAGNGSSTENANRPSLDAVSGRWTSPGDIIKFTGPIGPNDHQHLLVGGIGLPDDNLGDGHRHYFVKTAGGWQQVTVGAPDHTHDYNQAANGDPIPDWYMLFWSGSNADALALAADPDNYIIVQAAIDEEGNIGELDNTPWTAGELTLWQNRTINVLSIELPAEIDRGSRLVKLFLGSLLSRQSGDERGYRFT
jgi:hypothetical protein